MASSSSSSPKNSWNHDVFLSFRGPDTRNTFTGHLFEALHGKGINVFIDNELKRGEVITSQLLKVIEESRISVVILSENYASSSFCLDELVKILECRESKWQTVVPVFYHVDPTDVEEQRGTFGQEFAKLGAQFNRANIDENLNYWTFVPAKAAIIFRYILKWMRYAVPIIGMLLNEENEGATVQKWRMALTKVATLSGFHLKEGDHEATTIQSIVKLVLIQLDRTLLHVAEHPIGLASRVNDILEQLNMESDDVRMLGLHGMGGIGKTTIAKALYNTCIAQFQFDGSCFLLNVRERSRKDGFAQLQETILFEILGDEKRLFGNFDVGIELIKGRLCGKKVLIVIDDVDCREQLNKLAGGLEWFGAGSRIIITTRDLHLLKEHGVTRVHEVQKLEDAEAMELFRWHAFKEAEPSEVYIELSRLVVKYAQSLPLALKVLGSSLYGRNVLEWKDELEKLERRPNKKITDILKVSYDGLDCEEKAIFLDIAVFLKGKYKSEVIKFLKTCGFSAYIGVRTLVEKSLVYDSGLILEMHDLLVEMGTQIALEDSSRLCIQTREDILMFFENKRASNVEILLLDFDGEEEVPLNFLENLTQLRILVIGNGSFTKMLKKLSYSIRWLEWYNCPISTELLPTNLVVLKVPCNSINKTISKVQKFINITSMNFNGCMYLKKTIDLSALWNLEVLDLTGCEKLEKIKSFGNLKKLEQLNLEGCSSLTSLPNMVENRRLVAIDLILCSRLEKLPNLPISLESLCFNNSGIKEIPPFIGDLVNLHSILASNCKNLISVSTNIYNLPHLQFLYLENCHNLPNLLEAESAMFPSNLQTHGSKYYLILSKSKFVSLPTNAFKFIPIRCLYLDDCEWLVEIPELPECVLRLGARNCKSLVRFSQFQFVRFNGDFSNCHKLAVENEMESWRQMLQNEDQVSPLLEYDITLPGNEIPEWFSYVFECDSNDASFKLPPADNLFGIVWCVIFQQNPECTIQKFRQCLQFEVPKVKRLSYIILNYPPVSEHMWAGFSCDVHPRNSSQAEEIFCRFYSFPHVEVAFKRCGVHYIYKN